MLESQQQCKKTKLLCDFTLTCFRHLSQHWEIAAAQQASAKYLKNVSTTQRDTDKKVNLDVDASHSNFFTLKTKRLKIETYILFGKVFYKYLHIFRSSMLMLH